MTTPPVAPPSGPTRADDPAPILAKEGWSIIAIAVLLALLALAGGLWIHHRFGAWWVWAIALPVILLVPFCCWFFRDPQRRVPSAPGVVVAPADGLILAVEQHDPPEELRLDPVRSRGMVRVVIFLNVFNVHVNRTPIAGKVISTARRAGKFAHAGRPGADHNQRHSIALELADSSLAVVTQVTGYIARRIICRAERGATLRTGERYGLIRFGSRTDLYLPADATIHVAPGQTTTGGVTIIATLPNLTTPSPTPPNS